MTDTHKLSTCSVPDKFVDPEMFPVTPDHSAESSLHCQGVVSRGAYLCRPNCLY